MPIERWFLSKLKRVPGMNFFLHKITREKYGHGENRTNDVGSSTV